MNFFLYTTCLLLTLSGSLVNSQKEPCSYTLNDGVKYDFTSIAGKDVSTTINGYTYHLSICGTSSTQCQNDPDGVVEGMAVQTKPDPFGPKCYVLSQYDDSVTSNNWSPLIGTPSGVSLTLANGSPSDCPAGTPRQLALNFECGSTEEDKSFTVDDGGDCSYFTLMDIKRYTLYCNHPSKPKVDILNFHHYFGRFFVHFIKSLIFSYSAAS